MCKLVVGLLTKMCKLILGRDTWQTVFGNADDSMWTEFGYSAAFALDKTNWTLVIDFPGKPPTGTFFCIHIDQHIVGGGTYTPGGGVVYEYEKTIRISF